VASVITSVNQVRDPSSYLVVLFISSEPAAAAASAYAYGSILHVNFLAWVRAALLGSMQYAHCTPTPGMFHYSHPHTLQVFSMKLKLKDDNAGGFEFPLSVYGLVGVRDSLDFRRNMLFGCDWINAQELTQNVRSTFHKIDLLF
jgi:hypothetical protein